MGGMGHRATAVGLALLALVSVSDCSRGAPAAGSTMPKVAPGPRAVPPTVIGMNLGVPAYWSQEWAFQNIIKNTGDFTINGQVGFAPGHLSPGGWPQQTTSKADMRLFVQVGQKWQEGDYDCRVTPGWAVRVPWPPGGGTKHGDGPHFVLTIPRAGPGVQVAFQMDPFKDGGSLDELSCRPKGQPVTLFNPAFLKDIAPFGVIRFMDWMKTNNAGPRTWAERPLPTDLSLVPRGASVEDMLALANTAHADPWFTLPMDADAAYYREFAAYVAAHLDPGLHAYVELSNEVWNGSFKQSRDALDRGKAKYPGTGDVEATDYYYGDRVREVMAVWSRAFAANPKRLVRVAAAQAAWPERAEGLLKHGDTWRSVDALAIAPYFGTNIMDITEAGAPRVAKGLARLDAEASATLDRAERSAGIAHKFGLRLVAYEAGPEVTAFGPVGADAAAMLQDARFYDIYTRYMRRWQQRIGDVLVLFDDTGAGAFSHNAYTGQPLADATKMRAATDFANALRH